MTEFLRANLKFLAALFIAVFIFIFLAYFILGSGIQIGRTYTDENVYGTYSDRHLTAAGSFIVSYEYPEGSEIVENGFEKADGISVYYVFIPLKMHESYIVGSKKNFEEKEFFWKERNSDVETDGTGDNFIIDVYWPVESIRHSVKFSCIGDRELKGEIKAVCERFVESFRLD